MLQHTSEGLSPPCPRVTPAQDGTCGSQAVTTALVSQLGLGGPPGPRGWGEDGKQHPASTLWLSWLPAFTILTHIWGEPSTSAAPPERLCTPGLAASCRVMPATCTATMPGNAHTFYCISKVTGEATKVPFRCRRGDLKRVTAHWGCPNRSTHCLAEGSARFLAGAAKDCSLRIGGSIFAGPTEEGFTLSPRTSRSMLPLRPTPWASWFCGRPSPSGGSHGRRSQGHAMTQSSG